MSKVVPKTLVIDGVEFVQKSEQAEPAKKYNNCPFVIVRTINAGVFAGYLLSQDGLNGEMVEARRIHYWEGAASLSQLAMEGVKKPEKCRFAMPINVKLTQIIEVIYATEAARLNIMKVDVWKV